MLKLWLSSRRLQVVATTGVGIALLIVLLSPTFQECVKANYQHDTDQPFIEHSWVFVRTIWWCGGIFAKENGEAITGLASIAIAIFTWTLFRATNEQGRLIEQSISLARQEFLASNRPEMTLHSMVHTWLVGRGPESPTSIGALATYFNKGRTAAIDVTITGTIVKAKGELDSNIIGAWVERVDVVGPGTPHHFRVTSQISDEKAAFDQTFDTTDIIEQVYCIGEIAYSDGLGVPRRMGYCWCWNNYTWKRVSENPYEFSY